MVKVPIVIPSHKRADEVLTLKICPSAILCIPESQLENYRRNNPEANIITHPDTIKGISPKRNWIYKQFGDVVMLDDDILAFSRVYIGKNSHHKSKLTNEEIYGLIQDTYRLCKLNNIKFFGFNNTSHPGAFTGNEPINIGSFITGGCFGLLKDDNLYFPEDSNFVGEDTFINLLNAHYNRMCWIDKRFAVAYNATEKNQGGCADYRTDKIREESLLKLRQFFGESIKVKKFINPMYRTIKSKYEKIVVIDFWLNK